MLAFFIAQGLPGLLREVEERALGDEAKWAERQIFLARASIVGVTPAEAAPHTLKWATPYLLGVLTLWVGAILAIFEIIDKTNVFLFLLAGLGFIATFFRQQIWGIREIKSASGSKTLGVENLNVRDILLGRMDGNGNPIEGLEAMSPKQLLASMISRLDEKDRETLDALLAIENNNHAFTVKLTEIMGQREASVFLSDLMKSAKTSMENGRLHLQPEIMAAANRILEARNSTISQDS